ncbi:MAG TPA: ATP-dependent Clp protease ATP-binding subunit, partial [Lachnospiraceae bacterium]|nr:ATP-dependent Clp protease ATP-binding subunit [Lachnospiraceae bacterium]
YRGEFEERIRKVIREVTDDGNILLFLDELHTLIGAGGAEGAIDASNILKPS